MGRSFFYKSTYIFIALSLVYWTVLFFANPEQLFFYNLFGLLLTVVPLLGVITGYIVLNEWGGFNSAVGKAIVFLTCAMLMWFLGQGIYWVQSLYLEEVPYPGSPDGFFIFIDIFYAVALMYIMKFSGAKRTLTKNKSLKFLAFLVLPLISVYVNYLLFFGDSSYFEVVDTSVIFDLIYSFGSIAVMALLTITAFFSFNKLGGKMRNALYLMSLGIIFQYMGDISFAMLESLDQIYNGNPSDFIYFVSISFVTAGLIGLNTDNLSTGEKAPVNLVTEKENGTKS